MRELMNECEEGPVDRQQRRARVGQRLQSKGGGVRWDEVIKREYRDRLVINENAQGGGNERKKRNRVYTTGSSGD